MAQTPKASAFAVANFLLEKAKADGYPITHLQLQKLVYFCYAWYAGNKQEELFPEDIEAWQYGPVVRELYKEFRSCGSDPITELATTMDWQAGTLITPRLSPELESDLNPIWNAYKDKSAAWLVQATHEASEPWARVAAKYGGASQRKIPFSLIEQVYTDRVSRIDA